MEAYLRDLSLGEKQYLKTQMQHPFADGPIDLNAMAFYYDEARDMVVVQGLIVGDEIDGLEFPLPDFVAMVREAVADVIIYHSDEERAQALRRYLTELPSAEQQLLASQISTLTTIDEVLRLHHLRLLYDEDDNRVTVTVGAGLEKIDQFSLPLEVFLAVVRETS